MTFLYSSKECPACGSDHKSKPYSVYANGAHCFSCGYTKSYDRSFTRQERNKELAKVIPDWTNVKSRLDEFSLANQQWLNKYYITKEDLKAYNIYEAHDGALLFCNIVNGRLINYQKRYNTIPRRIFTYINRTPLKSSINSPIIALVEDPVSYVRLTKYIDVACLWGTNANVQFLESLLDYEKILVWLDNDTTKQTNSGQEAAKKICNNLKRLLHLKEKRFSFGGVKLPEVTNIVTNCDPKCYSPIEIQNILGEYYACKVK